MFNNYLKDDQPFMLLMFLMLVVLQLISDCLTIVVAAQMGKAFTGEVQAAFQKFLAVVVSALGRQYH